MSENFNHIFIDEHSKYHCPNERIWIDGEKHNNLCQNWSYVCLIGPKFFLFQIPQCLFGGLGDHDIIKFLVKSAFENCKKISFENYDIQKSYDADEILKENRKNNFNNNTELYQIHYLYENAASKQYAIASKIPLLTLLSYRELIKDSYNSIKKYLLNYNQTYLINKINIIKDANILLPPSEIEVIRSTEVLRKKIIKSISN